MNRDLPALSLKEPWCYAILHLGKSIENRSWATTYRGRIRLHASRTWDQEGADWLLAHGYEHPARRCFEAAGALGAYVGEVTVLNCLKPYPIIVAKNHPWAFGPICWELAHPESYPEPIPGRGYPGLYYPERFARSPQP